MNESTPDLDDFLLSLKWTETFALFFVFASDPVLKDGFLARLDGLFPSELERIEPSSHAAAAHEILGWVRAYPTDTVLRAPVLLDLSFGHDDPQWRGPRDNLLARLNESREILRQRMLRPVIIMLPVDYCPIIKETAPDLWSVRQSYGLRLDMDGDTNDGLRP